MLNFGKRATRGLVMGGAGWFKGETSLVDGFKQGWKSSGQTGLFKNKKSTVEAEQQGAQDGQAYGKGWARAVQILQTKQKTGQGILSQTLGLEQFKKNKAAFGSDSTMLNSLFPKGGLDDEARRDAQDYLNTLRQELNNGKITKEQLPTLIESGLGQQKGFDNKYVEDVAKGLSEKKIKAIGLGFDGMASHINSAGVALSNFGSILQGTPLEPFGQIIGTVGSALISLSTILATTKAGFLEQWAAATVAAVGEETEAGAALTAAAANGTLTVSSITAAGGMATLATAIGAVLLPLLAIAAIIGVVVGAYKLLDAAIETNKEKIESATDAAAAASEAYDSAKQETSELSDAIEQVKTNEDAFDGLVVGTAAFNEQLVTANDQIMELIKKYPMLNDYLTTDKNGLMHISDEGLNAVKDYQKQLQANASALNLIQTADLNSIEAQQKAEQMRKTKGTDTLESLAQRRQEADLVEQQAEAQQQMAKLNAVNTALVDKEIGNREKVSAILADQYDSRRKAISLEGESIHDLKQEYADFYGYKYDKSTKKMTDVEGNEIDVDKATIKDAVKDIRILTDIEVDGKSLDNMINHIDSTFSQALGSGFEESENLFSDILSDNIDIEDDLLQNLLTNPDKLQSAVDSLSEKEIAAVLGVSADAVEQAPEQYKDELTTKLTEKATNIAETQAQSYADLASMLAQTTSADIDQIINENGHFITQAQVHNKQAIEAQLEQLTSEQKNTLSSIGKVLTESAGADTMRTFIKQATDIYTKGTKESIDTLDKVIKDVNWSSPTARLKAYNDMINSTDKDVQNLGNSLRNSSESSNLLGEAFEEFYDSSDFQEMAENMDKFADSSGKLNASSIQEMAKECNSLNNLLDTGAISAGGVAAALNAMGKDGNITILDLNENLLKFLSTANQLDDVLSEAHSLIENFDWGIDTGESEDFAKDSTKKWKELYDNGEFGNQQLENYAKFVLGQERWNDELEKSGGNIETALNNMSGDILKYSDGFEQAWVDMANSSKDKYSSVYWKNGDIQWDTQGKTTQELVDWLAETRGITQEWAKLMVEDFANYSYDFKTELANNDYTAALKNGDYIEAHKGADNTTNITQSEVAALAAAQNKTEEEILKDIQKYGKISEDELNVIKNIDENGNLLMGNGDIKSLNTQYSQAELGKDTTQSWISQYEAKTPQGEKIEGSTDLKSAISAAIADGFQSEQATEMARMEALEAFNEGAKVFYDGVELNKEDLEDSQAFAEKVAEITENSRWNAVGEAIAQGYISYIKGSEDSSDSSGDWTSAKDGGDKGSTEPIDWSSGTDADIALREEMRAKARENWSQLWSSIKEAFTSGTPIEDPKAAAVEQSKENWKEIWAKVKEAFTSGESVEDPKIEAANKAKEAWKSLWDKVKEAFTNNPDINIDPKVNNNNNGKSTDTGSTKATGDLAVTYTGKVANPEELKASLEQQITTLLTSIAAQQSKMSATATVNVKQGTIEKPKAQKAVVNYTKGKQAQADKQTTTVDYKLGSQAAPKPKTAPVNYTLGTQAAPKAKTVDISPHFVGSWEKTITLKPASRGMNNTINPHTTPNFGSAAKGRYGTVGPKNKGGLTLTGEEGFEIAWLPGENRSMILGAKGPQLTNLPADTVVYTHEQSKKIIKQKAIPAGSHAGRHISTATVSTSASKQTKTKKDTHNDDIKKAAAEAVKITQKAGKVLVWWENAGYRMDKAQRNAEGVQRELKNLLKQFGTTAEQYKQSGETYEKYLNQQMQIAEEKEIRAKDELSMTTGGRSAAQKYLGIEKTAKEETTQEAASKRLKAAKAQLKKAKKTKGKGDDKKAQKKVDRLQKKYDKTAGAKKDKEANEYLEAIGARQEISYEVTKKKKDKKGKWKKTKTTKKTKINTANYIQTDPETGALQINQDAIDNIAKTNKSKAQAIADAVEKQLNDLLNKQKEAEDEKIKSEEALAEFYDDTYETFYSWDRVITEAYLLGQQLEKLSNLRNIYDSVEDLEFAKLEAGFSDVTKSLPKITEALERNKNIMVAQVQANSALVDATWSEYQKAFSIDTYKKRYESSPNSEKAAKDYDSMKVALDFLDSLNLGSNNFDYQAAVNSINANEWSQEDFNKIKDGLDKIAEKQGDYYNAIADTYTSMADIYKTIEEYQSYMADFESSLIKGLEEQANKEIDSLSKLNDTLSTAAKDLIDEVKRKLDERRKQEDNRKTEQDISQKQQRLAMLRANTSSGNQVEIARLEKEIAEAQQGYGRTLEDQLLDRLSQQQDEAAKQRERQISLLEAQRDLATALGTNVEEVNTWLADLNGNEELIKQAWLANNGYNEAGTNERKQLEEAFNEAWTRYKAYGEVLPSYEEIAGKYEGPDAPKPIVNPINSINDKMTTIIGLIDPKTAQDQNIIPPEASATTNEENPPKTNNTPQANNTPKIDRSAIKAKEELDRAKHEVQKKENLIKQYEQKISINEQNIGQLIRERSQIRDSRQISALNSRITSLQSQNNSYKGSIVKLQEEIRFLRNKYKFKKGGLASSTGPAWLDGTPTKPELVLNAQDTQNFLALRDILSKVIGSTNSITNSYGGNATYEININVDKIEKDYDVDRVIEKVKKEITKGAGYRNVTQVRSFR